MTDLYSPPASLKRRGAADAGGSPRCRGELVQVRQGLRARPCGSLSGGRSVGGVELGGRGRGRGQVVGSRPDRRDERVSRSHRIEEKLLRNPADDTSLSPPIDSFPATRPICTRSVSRSSRTAPRSLASWAFPTIPTGTSPRKGRNSTAGSSSRRREGGERRWWGREAVARLTWRPPLLQFLRLRRRRASSTAAPPSRTRLFWCPGARRPSAPGKSPPPCCRSRF